MPTLCPVHLSLITLQHPMLSFEYVVFRMEIADMDIEPNRITSETMQQIKQETAKDSVLASLCDVVASGWPAESKETPEHPRQYWSFRDEISVYNGVAYRSHQAIVLSSLREEMLQKIHKAHQGIDSSIIRARESLFWPGMQAAIKEKCLSCGLCARYVSERPQEPMKSHTIPIRPWSKISADLFQLDENNYPVMVDHYNDYIELDSLSGNTSANTVIRAMKRHFARHGIPDELVTDNGPQFESHKFDTNTQGLLSRFHHSQIITTLQLGKWQSRVSSYDCQEHFEEVSEKGSLSGTPSIQKNSLAGLQLLPSTTSHVKKAQRYQPYSTPSTHPRDSFPKS